jgi:pentapeptide repeat protein
VNIAGRRDAKRDIRPPDLTGADLTAADLSYAKLGGANLRGADLAGALWPGDTRAPEGWRRVARTGRLERSGAGTGQAEAT